MVEVYHPKASALAPLVAIAAQTAGPEAFGGVPAAGAAAGVQLAVFVKERWTADARQAGRQLSGSTAAAPGGRHVATELGLRFGLRLLGQQHVGLFLDTRPARAAVATRPGPATGRCVT